MTKADPRPVHELAMIMANVPIGQSSDYDVARVVLESKWLADRIHDEVAGLLHPEFGTEWREPDGVIYKAVQAARQERPNLGNMAPVISFLKEVKTSGNAAMYLEAEADQILGEVFGIEDE